MDNDQYSTSPKTETLAPFDTSTANGITAESGDATTAPEPHDLTEFDELLARWEDQYRLGQEPALESLCGIDSPLFERLRDRIGKLKQLYALLGLPPTETAGSAQAGELSPAIPGHEVIAEIGRGGMGVVYKARDQTLGRIVAIKTIPQGRYATADQRERFLAEAHAIARLHHTNIIAIHAIGEHDNRPYLSLEFAGGGSLAQRLAEKPMAAPDAAALVETLARAVHAAHLAGIVHRDLKPSNVLLTAEGVPKVSDFGLAKLLDDDSARTLSGQPLGTPSYMAPEQAEGRSKHVGPSADIYALGAILYHALTGRPPFLGESALETLKLVTSTEAVPPRRLRPDVPRDLETICLKCLDKRPAQRYSSATELADDLRRFQNDEPIQARRIGVLPRFFKWSKRHPWQAALAATVLAAASGFIGLTYRHNAQLRAEVKRTESKADEARRNYQQARATIGTMLGRLNDRRLAGSPRLMEVRRDVREDALAFYDQILRQVDSNDPIVRADTARALHEASALLHALGDAKAEEYEQRALQLTDALLNQRPDDLELMSLHRDCLITLAFITNATGSPDTGRDYQQKALALAQRLADALPENIEHQERLAQCHNNIGGALIGSKHLPEARMEFEKAIEIRSKIDPRSLPGVTQNRAQSITNVGLTYWQEDNYVDAENSFRSAEQVLLSDASDLDNQGADAVYAYGQLMVNWGGMLQFSKRPDKAVERSDDGLKCVEKYLSHEPNDMAVRELCLKLHGNRALCLADLRRHRESADDWARVVELSTEPVPPGYRIQWAVELVKAGDIPRAVLQVQLVKPEQVVSGEDRYDLAIYHAASAAAAASNTRVPPDRRASVDDPHIKDALRWLKLAAETGFFNVPAQRDNALKDPVLASLHDNPEFRRLIEPAKTKP
jgi:tetratricopeptide (TPR) repeat protein